MKIRRILATAVAAAVTTPVVFLSAAPAFADTKPGSSQTQKPASDDLDEKAPSIEELKAAVVEAQKAYDEAVVDVAKAKEAIDALDKADHPLKAEVLAAKAAADEAAAAKTAADEALAKAQKAVEELADDATPEQKQAAADAVTAAQAVATAAAPAKTAADDKLKKASKALADAGVAAFRVLGLAEKVKTAAAEDLAEAQEELEFLESIEGDCDEDDAVKVALSGPKSVTAGAAAVFSLRVTNTSERTLDEVEALAYAAALPDSMEDVDDESDFKEYITIEWSSADVPKWTPVTEESDAIEIGALAAGKSEDVKLRLTLAADTPVGPGVAFAAGAYQNNDDTCGFGEEYATANFEILAGKGDKPKPTPSTTTPAPSPSTTTPTPAPTVTAGNTGTTQQGGSSRTPVNNGALASTGANDTLPLGLAAAGAVVLGAGALVIARRRKAGANA